MKRWMILVTLATLALLPRPAAAQISNPPIQFQSNGTPLGVSFTFNCTTGLTCAITNGVFTIQSSGGGSGTVNSGTGGQLAYYAANGTAVSGNSHLTYNTTVGGSPSILNVLMSDASPWSWTIQDLAAPAGTYTAAYLDGSGNFSMLNAPSGSITGNISMPASGGVSIAGSTGSLTVTNSAATSTVGVVAPSYSTNGSGAGYFQCTAGTAPGVGATSTIRISCPATATAYEILFPTASSTGLLHAADASNVNTWSISAVTSADATGNTSGSGNFCLVTSCVMVTPTLGVATATSVATGTSPPTCTIGTAGASCYGEGTAPTGASSVDDIYADSTGHCLADISNNVALGCHLTEPVGLVGVQTITGADYTNTSVTPSTVFSWTLPATAVAKNYRYTCDIMWESTAATLVGPVFGINMSAAATQVTAMASVQNTLAGADVNGYLSNTTTGSQTLVTAGAAGVTSTNYWAKIWGTIEAAPTAGATFIINAASTSGTTASLNIRRGSGCTLRLIQ